MGKAWFKFYGQEFLADPKMLSLTPIEKALWLTTLCLASASEEEGIIKFINEEKIMMITGINYSDDQWEANLGFLEKFEELGMIHVTEDRIEIVNYTKRQEAFLTNAERQARFRKKNKSNGKVTTERYESNARIDKRRIDKNTVSANGDKNLLKKLPTINQDNDHISVVKDFLVSKLNDKKSERYYYLVAQKLPEGFIRETISEILKDGADDPRKVFAFRVNQYALTLKMQL